MGGKKGNISPLKIINWKKIGFKNISDTFNPRGK